MSSSKESALLKSKFLAGLTEEERKRIFLRTSELSTRLEDWAVHYPRLMRPVRARQLALTLSAAAPFVDVHHLVPAAFLSMWLFIVDDLVDEGEEGEDGKKVKVPVSKLEPLFEQCVSLLEDARGVDPQNKPVEPPLLKAMWEIREQLDLLPQRHSAKPARIEALSALLRPRMAGFLRQLMEGMRREDQWSAIYQGSSRGPLPTFSEYLKDAGIHSIGVLPVYACMLIAMGDCDESIPSRLPDLLGEGRRAALKIRLANDLRSFERELAEKKLNSLVLLQREIMREEGSSEAAALEKARLTVNAWIMPEEQLSEQVSEQLSQRVLTQLDGLLRELLEQEASHAQLAQAPLSASGASLERGSLAERYVSDLSAFVCNYYAHHDYHHTPKLQEEP